LDAIPKATIFGLQVWGISIDDLARQIGEWVGRGEGHWIATLNLDYIARCAKSKSFHELLSRADVFTADGMPVLRACQKIDTRFESLGRTTGADLTPRLIELLDPSEVAIVGGADPASAIRRLGRDPKLYFIFDGKVQLDEAWACDLAARIRGRNAVLVALGCPKQEQLIALLKPHLPNAVFIAVGGSFELMAGMKSRAPQWMQRAGLEWLHRLLIEPRRLWHRYLVEYPPGALALYREVRAARATASKTLPPS